MTEKPHHEKNPRSASVLHPPENLRAYLYHSVDSTNQRAKELLRTVDPPFVVAADVQTAGRGTKGRSFYSPEGSGLYASYCFSVPVARLSSVTPRAAVAVALAMESFGKQPAVKWVNDLRLGEKKVGGILTESVIRGENAPVIIGIGLNLFPAKAVPEALQEIIGTIWDTREEARPQALFERMTKQLRHFVERDPDFLEEYRRLSCVIGRRLQFFREGEWHEATGTGIDPDGKLLIETANGMETLYTEEIRLEPRGGMND